MTKDSTSHVMNHTVTTQNRFESLGTADQATVPQGVSYKMGQAPSPLPDTLEPVCYHFRSQWDELSPFFMETMTYNGIVTFIRKFILLEKSHGHK